MLLQNIVVFFCFISTARAAVKMFLHVNSRSVLLCDACFSCVIYYCVFRVLLC